MSDGPTGISEADGRLLTALVVATRPRRCVELGSGTGAGTTAIIKGLAATGRCGRLATFDRKPEYVAAAAIAAKNVLGGDLLDQMPFDSHGAEARARATVLKGHGGVGFLFVDADHRAEGVAADLDVWLPAMAERGIVVLHDATAERPGLGVLASLRLMWDGDWTGLVFPHGCGYSTGGPDDNGLAILQRRLCWQRYEIA